MYSPAIVKTLKLLLPVVSSKHASVHRQPKDSKQIVELIAQPMAVRSESHWVILQGY